jgi:hypothetical protein
MPNKATDCCARDGMMTRHMTHNTAHRSAFQTTLRATQVRQQNERRGNCRYQR